MSASQSTGRPEWAVGYVYLLDTSDRYQKIGYSRDPYTRANGFQGLPFCVWLAHHFPVGTPAIESVVHQALAHKRIRGEWFILSREEVALVSAVTGARTADDLPPALRPRPARVNRRPAGCPSGTGGRRPKPWYRTGRKMWYVWFDRVQYALHVADPLAYDAANAAASQLVASINPHRVGDLERVGPAHVDQTGTGTGTAAGT